MNTLLLSEAKPIEADVFEAIGRPDNEEFTVQFFSDPNVWIADSVHFSLAEALRRASIVLNHFEDKVRVIHDGEIVLEDAEKP